MKTIAIACIMLALTACGALKDKGYDKVADLADRYCSETIDADVRQKIVDKINERTDRATIAKIECE